MNHGITQTKMKSQKTHTKNIRLNISIAWCQTVFYSTPVIGDFIPEIHGYEILMNGWYPFCGFYSLIAPNGTILYNDSVYEHLNISWLYGPVTNSITVWKEDHEVRVELLESTRKPIKLVIHDPLACTFKLISISDTEPLVIMSDIVFLSENEEIFAIAANEDNEYYLMGVTLNGTLAHLINLHTLENKPEGYSLVSRGPEVTIADVDGDGFKEVVALVITTLYFLHEEDHSKFILQNYLDITVLDTNDNRITNFTENLTKIIRGEYWYEYVAVGNFDEDPNHEILLIINKKQPYPILLILNLNKELNIQRVSIPEPLYCLLMVACTTDLNGDSISEILLSNRTDVLAIEPNGSILWRTHLNTNGAWIDYILSFDVDNDFLPEVVCTCSSDFHAETMIHVIDSDGSPLTSITIPGCHGYAILSVADIDGDGSLEILSYSTLGGMNTTLALLELSTSPFGDRLWFSFHGDYMDRRWLVDEDCDGVADYLEPYLGLDPHDRDSDGDGLIDGKELFYVGTDPRNPDTDGDGFLDGVEVIFGTNPLDPSSKLSYFFLFFVIFFVVSLFLAGILCFLRRIRRKMPHV